MFIGILHCNQDFPNQLGLSSDIHKSIGIIEKTPMFKKDQ